MLASPTGMHNTTPASAAIARRGAPATLPSVQQCDRGERKCCAMQTAIMCEGVPPMIRLLHMLPSWPVGRWKHGILGHRRAISARQRDRSGGAAMGVGLQKEWRGSAADWRRKVDLGAVSVAVSTGANRRVATRGCKNFEEIKVSNALELVPWAIDFE